MVPARFVGLPELPLTPNGKLDQRALPTPTEDGLEDLGKPFVPPDSETERKIAEIWQDVLGITQVGRTDNFFDLGGDSLRLMRVRNQLQRAFAREVPIVDMFRCTTVGTLAQYLTAGGEVTVPHLQSQDRIEARKDAARRRLQLRQEARVN